eukprot:maker-scaffold239_size242058-snap-gene-1.21 protein:Tk09814 transcript:maker-scaffold239_size242058-snap-gene-1.21-mRNA-1 annotation:"hypothetical protein AaeL_AAEL006680"
MGATPPEAAHLRDSESFDFRKMFNQSGATWNMRQPQMPQMPQMGMGAHPTSQNGMGNGLFHPGMSGGGVMNNAGTFMARGSGQMPNPSGLGVQGRPMPPPQGMAPPSFLSDNLMLPPTQATQARRQEIAQERKQAALQRRQEHLERQKREQQMNDPPTGDLFARPERVKHDDTTAQQASQVLGNFSSVQRIINSQSSCIGIDYQPPTPAPSQHHIIGDEDDDDPDFAVQGSQMRSSTGNSASMARGARRPPATIPPPPTGGVHMSNGLGNRNKDMGKGLSKLQLPEPESSKSITEILQEMKDPLGDGQTPLSAIITPHVSSHEGNNARAQPRYFGVTPGPHFGEDDDDDIIAAPISPIKSSKVPFTNKPIENQALKQKKVSNASHHNLNLSDDSDSEGESTLPTFAMDPPSPQLAPIEPPASPVEVEAPPPKAASVKADDSSSDSSDSESSSEEEAEESKDSSSDHDEVNNMDNDATFGLANILAKVKSTHSPGPNPHPSPKVTQTTPIAKPMGDEMDEIEGLLSQTHQSLPDIHLGTSDCDMAPLSPLLDEPLSPLKKDPTPPARRSSHGRRSSSIQNSSSDDEPTVKPTPPRKARKHKSKAATPAAPVGPVSPPARKATPVRGSMSRTETQQTSLSTAPMLSSDSETEEAPAPTPAAALPHQSPLKSVSAAEKRSKPRHSRKKSRDDLNSTTELDESNSPNTSKAKSRAVSRIFMSRSKPTGTGGKGGKGGKGGITVERKNHPESPLRDFAPVKRRPEGRPTILCQIPVNLLAADFEWKTNRYEGASKRKSGSRRSRKTSGESVSSNSSKHSFRSTSSHKRANPFRADLPAPHKRVKLDETKPAKTFAKVEPMTSSSSLPGPSSDSYSKPQATVAPTPNNAGGANAAPWANKLMPPPSKVFYSYLEKHREEEVEAEEDLNAYMMEAKRLKHEADRETNQGRQAMKYLQAVLFFSLCGNYHEQRGDKVAAFTMYKETLNLIKHVCRPLCRNSEYGNFDNKLAVLSLRCQSLLYLQLYKLRRHELKECQKIILDHIQKANASQQNSPVGNTGSGGVAANAISPTPSPAGSEGSVCSKSSGYTSSGEVTSATSGRYTGVLTPPTNPPPCLSVPQSVMQKQHQYCNYVSQCHELWEMADVYTLRGNCEDFIIHLDGICGPLTLHSSLKDLVNYTRNGLEYVFKAESMGANSNA